VKEYNNNILIIANKTRKNDFDIITELVKTHFPDDSYPILELKETTAFEKILEKGQSIQSIIADDKLLRFSYSKVVEQFKEIVKFIKNNIDE
jgi:hypothetical protein